MSDARDEMSTRTRIRQVVIDGMEPQEVRELVLKMQMAFEGNYKIDEELFEEYVGEVISARGSEAS